MFWTLGGVGLFVATTTAAQDVGITRNMASVTVVVNGQTHTITRNQDPAHQVTGDAALTSRPCPPDCVTPMIAGPGVATVGELEVIAFLSGDVSEGRGLLLDTRDPGVFAGGAVPGAVNVPVATLDPANPYRLDILIALGATAVGDGLDFTNAFDLMLMSGGPWAEDSVQAVRHLLDAGYPPAKLFYYRGGLQAWQLLGLSTVPSDADG